MKKLFLISLLTILLNPTIWLPSASFAQKKERWDVKILSDGFKPSDSIVKTTVAEVEKLPLVKVRNRTPRMESERQTIEITGKITRKSLEADGDYHIEVSDGTCKDSTIACEAVNPRLAPKSSVLAKLKAVRLSCASLSVGDTVTVTGNTFQDKFHNPSPHRIRNFKEIHPITKIVKAI